MTVGLEPGQIGALPTASGPLPGRATDAVLTVETYKKENNQVVSMFYYKDNIYDLATWQRHMQEPGEHLPRGATAVLLLKASGDLDIQTFLDICDTANKAGFTSVQIAAQPSAPAPAPPAMP
jgi:biopolymer transport protein ExbD